MISLDEFMRRPIYEPRRRWCGGTYGWVAHRFPVKNGISMRDVLLQQLLDQHPLMKAVRLVVKERQA